jgi:ALG3 protein
VDCELANIFRKCISQCRVFQNPFGTALNIPHCSHIRLVKVLEAKRRPSSIYNVLFKMSKLDADDILLALYTSNFVGILFARSLHYQFYSWYFYTIPYLLWRTDYHVLVKLALFLAIEYSWNVFPSTGLSSTVLFVSHLALLFGIVTEKSVRKLKIK